MSFVKVEYSSLNSKQKEIYNFQKVAGVLADYVYNCIKLADDWQGADFLAYHKDGKVTLRVQLKARLTVRKCYIGQNLYIAFPHKGSWYVIAHDSLLKKVKIKTNWLQSKSWTKKGIYSSGAPSLELIQSIKSARLKNA